METRRQLKRQGAWRGERTYRAVLDDYRRLARMIDAAGGEFDPRWPAGRAWLALVVLAARAEVRRETAAHGARN